MEVINAVSVSDALNEALYRVHSRGIRETSRNGATLVMPEPVTTVYRNPQRRVLFSPMRDANPFFHLMESLWMLRGRNDLYFPLKFNKRFGEYSDDGKTIWGAYGWRWREFFGYDQLNRIVDELTKKPDSRRCVLSMWNAMEVDEQYSKTYGELQAGAITNDLDVGINGGKDVPCNTHAYFDLRGGVLNMTVCNRSNDMLWGCYGANAVHFSMLLEYMAAKIGVPVGVYRQVSNNLHLYTDIVSENTIIALADDVALSDRYITSHSKCNVLPLVDCDVKVWEENLRRFFCHGGLWNEHVKWESKFIGGVAVPMYRAHAEWRDKNYEEAMEQALQIIAWDWRIACIEWLERRESKRKEKFA